jgi:tetratricopeptide (TPR) repeat protein
VIENDPMDDEAFFYLAASCYNLSMYEDALKSYNKAIAIHKDNATYFLERARAFNALKQYPDAISDLNETLRLKEQFAEAYLLRGIALYNTGELSPALADFTAAIRIDPDYYDAYIERGYCYNKMKRSGEAINDLKKAYTLFPTNYLSLVDIIEINFVNGKKEDAASYLKEANKLQWTAEQSIVFTFFNWLFKKSDHLDAEQEKANLTKQLETYKGMDYNFSEIREWLHETSLEPSLKEEITTIIDALDLLNKK